MKFSTWRDDLLRREAAYTTERADVPAMDPGRRYPLSSDDCQILRKMDAAFQERA